MICLKNNNKFNENDENNENLVENEQNCAENHKNNYKILTITEKGIGKRCDISEYRLQTRAGKGVKAGVFNDKTGLLVGLKQIFDNEDVILISDQGTIIRINSNEISEFGRDTLGVRVMRVREDEKIVSMAVTLANEDDIVDQVDVDTTTSEPSSFAIDDTGNI